MTDEERKTLLNIADCLTSTLSDDVSPDDADTEVAEQVGRIYKLLGYEVKTFVLGNKAHVISKLEEPLLCA